MGNRCPQCNKMLKIDDLGRYCPDHGCEGQEGIICDKM